MLLEEVDAEIEIVNEEGAKAFQTGDYNRAQEMLQRAGQITAFRDKVAALRKEWDVLSPVKTARTTTRANLGRLQRGMRTPEAAYYQPILRALNGLGGSAKMGDVLIRVEQELKGTLKPVDYEPLTSEPDTPRWRNGAQ